MSATAAFVLGLCVGVGGAFLWLILSGDPWDLDDDEDDE